MAEITLVAEAGRTVGSRPSARLRAAGRVPGVVYGHGAEPIAVSVDARELRHALSGGAGLNQLLSLNVGGEAHLALARELQRHPVRHTVTHVDFQVVNRDEVITAEVPITLVGEAKAVESDRGVVGQVLMALSVHARPGDIPAAIEVDVTGLAVGDTVRVEDLDLPKGVSTDVDASEAVVVAAPGEMGVVPEAGEAGAEAAQGEGTARDAPARQDSGGVARSEGA